MIRDLKALIDPYFGLPVTRRPSQLDVAWVNVRNFLFDFNGSAIRDGGVTHFPYRGGGGRIVRLPVEEAKVKAETRARAIFVVGGGPEKKFNVRWVIDIPKLMDLNIGAFVRPENLDMLGGCASLERFSCEWQNIDVPYGGGLTGLRELAVSGANSVLNIERASKTLSSLSISRSKFIHEEVSQLSKLSYLKLTDIQDFSGIKACKLPLLRVLVIQGASSAGLEGFVGGGRSLVTHVKIADTRNLENLDFLAECDNLKILNLENLRNLQDIQKIKKAPNLKKLAVVNCPELAVGELEAMAERGVGVYHL